MPRSVPWLPADILAAQARVAALLIREQQATNRRAEVLAADIAKLEAAREVLFRHRVASHGLTILDREADKLRELLAEVAA